MRGIYVMRVSQVRQIICRAAVCLLGGVLRWLIPLLEVRKETNTMSIEKPETLLNEWKQHRLPVLRAVGQLLQYLVILVSDIAVLKQRQSMVNRRLEQVETSVAELEIRCKKK